MALKLGFLASHNGSSMRAIVAAAKAGTLAVEPVLVASNNAESPALAFARAEGIPARHISATTAGSPEAADAALAQALSDAGADWVVMSGYMRKLGPKVLAAFPNRILNVHPALLPKHGGHGLYGGKVHAAVLAAGETVSGPTIHLVDEEYDRGPILAQAQVPVRPDDTPETLQARVVAREPDLYIEVLQRIVAGQPLRLVR
jgi:phosphoribosylglycinamide formyltransferase-1